MKYSLPPFLQKLVTITESVPESVASWSDDGNSFVVHNSDKFERLLHKHFKGSLQTFVRQLHFYAFSKVVNGSEWSFQHKNFRRDHPQLVYEIRRKTRKTSDDGVASQQEVKLLRKHITVLQERITAMNKQFLTVQSELAEVRENERKRAAETSFFPAQYERMASVDFPNTSNSLGTGGFKRQRMSRSISTTSNFSLSSVGGLDRLASLGNSIGQLQNSSQHHQSSSLAPLGKAKRQNSLEILPLVDFMDDQLDSYSGNQDHLSSASDSSRQTSTSSFPLQPSSSTGTAPDGDQMPLDSWPIGVPSETTSSNNTKIKVEVEAKPTIGASKYQNVELPKDIQLPKDLDPKMASKVLGSFLAIATACCKRANDMSDNDSSLSLPNNLTRSSSVPETNSSGVQVQDEFNVAMKHVYKLLEKSTKSGASQGVKA